ncbi:MAG TPA: hypothetical protein VJN22_08070 [Candidatus Eremiobacteraceae bacterium]|nr:hypothetical protein [Candidatus Eremiobacteraceae bacterium]
MRIKPAGLALALALVIAPALAGCNDHSLSLDLTPNPLVVGLTDTQATVHAHVVAKGFGSIPFSSVQFAVFNGEDSMLASQTEPVDATMQAAPFGGIAVNKDYTFPINGALVALSGTKYVMVKILDPSGNVLTQSRLNIDVHLLKGLNLPSVLQPAASPHP